VSDPLLHAVRAHRAHDAEEARDVARVLELVEAEVDPWSRDLPLHITASALVLDPAGARVLLRWHAKQQRWLQVGGHGDPGERDPWLVACREAEEETGLTDLAPVVRAIFQVTIVTVNAAGAEPAHEHADLRYLLRTGHPEDAPPEREGVALRWFGLDEALGVADDGLARLLRRVPGVG
jgi:8-oxo-dGTP pyrophosphatase MutT (NUDIX family)